MFISFGWTWPALGHGKVVTRRYWKASHAKKFKAGLIVEAWDKVPYAKGKKIGKIRITRDAFQQRTGVMTIADYVDEGFQFFDDNQHLIPRTKSSPLSKIIENNEAPCPCAVFFRDWREKNDLVWVVKFEVAK